MTPVRPSQGGSGGTWGSELNAWLDVSHNSDGTLGNPGSNDLVIKLGGTVQATFKNAGDLRIGPNLGFATAVSASWTDLAPIDFFYDPVHRRLFIRTALFRENGDTPELALQRSDGTYPDGAPAAIASGVALGLIHWTGWDGSGFNHRSAQIYARAAEDIDASHSGGSLYLATTPNGTIAGTIDRIKIAQDGAVLVLGGSLSESQGDALAGRGDIALSGKVYAIGDVVARSALSGGSSTTQVAIGQYGPSNEAGIAFDSTPQARLYLKSNSYLRTDGDFEARQLKTISGGGLTLVDGNDITIGTSTGSKIGQSGSKLAFYGSTPIVRAVLATGASHTVDDVITALQNLGLVKQS